MFTAVPCIRSASFHSAYDSHVHGIPVVERIDRNVFDEAEHVGGAGAIRGADRRERERAVAGDDGGDAVLGHRVDERVPPHRRVVVRVAVDESGSDDRAAGVDLRFAVGLEVRADLDDDPVAHTNIGSRRAGAPVPSTNVPPRTNRSPAMAGS